MRAALLLAGLLASSAVALDIGSTATWSLDLSQAPGQNTAVESVNYVGSVAGGYQQLVDVGGRHTSAH